MNIWDRCDSDMLTALAISGSVKGLVRFLFIYEIASRTFWLKEDDCFEDYETVTDIVSLITKYDDSQTDVHVVMQRIKEQCDNKIPDTDIAKNLCISQKFMQYLFKKITGITTEQYKKVIALDDDAVDNSTAIGAIRIYERN